MQHTAAASVVAHSNTLKFGRRWRALPTVLERLSLAFCSLQDLGALSVCSHAVFLLVIDVLAPATALECHLSDRHGARGLSLLVRPSLVRHLASLVVTVDSHILASDNFRLLRALLLDIITQHRGTLERLEPAYDQELLLALTECPNLRRFSLVKKNDDMFMFHRPDAVCQQLAERLIRTGCRLSHFDVHCGAVEISELSCLLLTARLQQLTLRSLTEAVLNVLQIVDVSSLHTLALLDIAMDSLHMMAEDFRGFLMTLPALTTITFGFGSSIQNTEFNPFELPHVTHIEQRGDALAFIAPKLRYFTGPLQPSAIVPLTRHSAHLVSLVDTTDASASCAEVKASARGKRKQPIMDVFQEKEIVRNGGITEALCSNVWRQLEVLQLVQPIDLLALGEALLLWTNLRTLKLRLLYAMPANTALRLILSAAPKIEHITLNDSAALPSMYASIDKGDTPDSKVCCPFLSPLH